jgi:hypothetical protein
MEFRNYVLLSAVFAAFVPGLVAPEKAVAESLVDKALSGTIEKSIAEAQAALDKVLKERIDQFLNGADGVATDLINKGANEGRLALVQAGNEMQIAIGVARSQFGNEMDHQIESASAALQPILLELQRWRDAKDELEGKAFEMEDLIAMDLGRLPLSPDYFGIRRLSGTAFLENAEPTYRIGITGDNFGTEVVGQTVTVTATFDDVPLTDQQKQAPEKVFFNVPATMVAGRFKTDQIATVPFHITVTRVKNHWLFGSWWPSKVMLEHEIKVALLPDLVGELIVETSRPKYDWVDDAPASQSKAIAQDTSFAFDTLTAKGPQGPEKGNQRYGDPVATCGPITQNAWKLYNGNVVLDSDPLIQRGWTSPSWVGQPEPPDWNRFDAMARALIGWTPGFSNNNRCSHGNRCTLSPDEIKSHSQAITIPFEECSRMRMVEKNFSSSRNSLSVWIRGKATHESLWTVTAPIQTYKEVSIIPDDPVGEPVYVSKPTQFDIKNPSLTVTTLRFRPKNGSEKTGILPNGVPKGPQPVSSPQPLGGNLVRYFYQYSYDKNLFNGQ